ncbi:MAG: uracil-DNA glycosylase [Bacillota bacterium]|nr:uracil-DNA glycosylase [Bacillota bacterium]
MARTAEWAGEEGAWRSHVEQVVHCRLCPRLVAWREEVARTKVRRYRDQPYWGRPVPGFGDRQARLLLLGLAPAAHGANRTGRMFTGDDSGDFLIAALHRAGLANQPFSRSAGDGLRLRDCFLTAPVRCAPPGNRPTREEILACRPHLRRELALLPRVRAVLALGRVAWEVAREEWGASMPPGERWPSFAHGQVARPLGGPAVVASYHPSRQNTQTGRLTATMFDQALATALRLARGGSGQAAGEAV